jgi:hypothetical protein
MGLIRPPARTAAVTSRRSEGNGCTSTRRGRSAAMRQAWRQPTLARRGERLWQWTPPQGETARDGRPGGRSVADERHGVGGGIRHRQVSSREVVQAHLQRVEAVNPGVNAHHGCGGASGVRGPLRQMSTSS